MNAKNMIVNP